MLTTTALPVAGRGLRIVLMGSDEAPFANGG
jgi:hypothetical protein